MPPHIRHRRRRHHRRAVVVAPPDRLQHAPRLCRPCGSRAHAPHDPANWTPGAPRAANIAKGRSPCGGLILCGPPRPPPPHPPPTHYSCEHHLCAKDVPLRMLGDYVAGGLAPWDKRRSSTLDGTAASLFATPNACWNRPHTYQVWHGKPVRPSLKSQVRNAMFELASLNCRMRMQHHPNALRPSVCARPTELAMSSAAYLPS